SVRGDARQKLAGIGRDYHCKDRDDRARELGGGRSHADAGQLQRDYRLRDEPVRPEEGSAPGYVRWPAGDDPIRIEFGDRHGRQLVDGKRRDRNVGVYSESGAPVDARADATDSRPDQSVQPQSAYDSAALSSAARE